MSMHPDLPEPTIIEASRYVDGQLLWEPDDPPISVAPTRSLSGARQSVRSTAGWG